MKISQEARDIYDELNAHYVQGDGQDHEWLDFEAVEVIQSLINQTIERAAVVADGLNERSWVAEVIAQAIRDMKG